MFDAILHTTDYEALLAYLRTNAPDHVGEDNEGAAAVIGLSSTPPVKGDDGSRMTYARFGTKEELEFWGGIETVTILGWAEYTGTGTGDAVYQMVWDTPEHKDLYDSTYPRPVRSIPTGELEFVITTEEPMEVTYVVDAWGTSETHTVSVDDPLILTLFYGSEVTLETEGAELQGPVELTRESQAPEKFGIISGA